MSNSKFDFHDLEQDCYIESGQHHLDGRALGLRIHVPQALRGQAPYNSSAYRWMQQLRSLIYDCGIIEFPGLPVNKCNYTLAQRAPQQHRYSDNSYLTDLCQSPHQDIPPYPSAFWLEERRKYSATWLLSAEGANDFFRHAATQRALSIDELHRALLPTSLESGHGALINREPGLVLLDNSAQQSLYHARTCNFAALAGAQPPITDTPMYAYNEPGLLQHIDQLDSRRGAAHRNTIEREQVREFLAAERAQNGER